MITSPVIAPLILTGEEDDKGVDDDDDNVCIVIDFLYTSTRNSNISFAF